MTNCAGWKRSRFLFAPTVSALASIVGVTSVAQASLTPVTPTPNPTEDTRAEILSHVYGGTFSREEANYSNGLITALRIDDSTDRLYQADDFAVTPVAQFSQATQTQSLQYLSSGQSQSLFSVDQFGYLDDAQPTEVNASGERFRFTLDTTNRTSAPADPSLSVANQFVTYEISGTGDAGRTYMIFWEDSPLLETDRDFNDLVVEASFNGSGGLAAGSVGGGVGGSPAVPLPPAAWLGLTTFAGYGLFGWMKRKLLPATC